MRVNSLDLVSFFRDNKLIVSESDCYMIVKMYDSNFDGSLSLIDFMLIVSPRAYTYTKNFVASSSRRISYAQKQTNLNYDMEFAVMQVL